MQTRSKLDSFMFVLFWNELGGLSRDLSSEIIDFRRGGSVRGGAKHHQLFLGKPSGDYYIDDKGVNDEDFFDTGN